MKVSELVADLLDTDQEATVFIAKDGHSVECDYIEQAQTFCAIDQTRWQRCLWQRCLATECDRQKTTGVLLA